MDEVNSPDQSEQGAAPGSQPPAAGSAPPEDSVPAVQTPELEELEQESVGAIVGPTTSLDIVMDVPVSLSLEVGKAIMSVGDLLRLGQGAVVELDRGAGEPLDVMVNGALVARGEIVLVNEKFGIRLTEVITSSDEPESEN